MGLTINQVRAWRPATVIAANGGLTRTLERYERLLDEAMNDTNRMAGSSQGDGEAARYKRAGEATRHGYAKLGEKAELRQAVEEAGHDLEAKQGQLLADVRDARHAGLQVWNDGVVEGDAPRQNALIAKHAKNIGQSLHAAEQAHDRFIQKIRDITAKIREGNTRDREALGVIGDAKDAHDPSKDAHDQAKAIAEGTMDLPNDPKQLHDFWTQLDKDEKDSIYSRYHNIGNYDGIPCSDRDHYNRRHLGEIGGHVADEVGKNIGPEGPNGRTLLHVDPQGHVAVATRDPDKAKNVVTFIPGAGTGLDASSVGQIGTGIGLREGMGICESIQKAANTKDPGSTAVVYWDNYAAPSLAGAASSDPAIAGAPKLDSFLDGLHASHDDSNGKGHYTVEGWSYGSTLVGEAASHGRSLNTDDVISVGGPGMDVGHATDLRLTGHDPNSWNHGHVHATVDAGDPIIGPLAKTGALGELLGHGTLPTDQAFGGKIFESTPHTLGKATVPGTEWHVPRIEIPGMNGPISVLPGFDIPFTGKEEDIPSPQGHYSYWDDGNVGLTHQAEIITGQ